MISDLPSYAVSLKCMDQEKCEMSAMPRDYEVTLRGEPHLAWEVWTSTWARGFSGPGLLKHFQKTAASLCYLLSLRASLCGREAVLLGVRRHSPCAKLPMLAWSTPTTWSHHYWLSVSFLGWETRPSWLEGLLMTHLMLSLTLIHSASWPVFF